MAFDQAKTRLIVRKARHTRVRRTIHGTAARPRLSVRRSLNHIYAQLTNDESGRVLCTISTLTKDVRDQIKDLAKNEAAQKVGEAVGKKAKELGIEKVVFDRAGYLFHGRVKALADGARAAGLNF